MEKVLTTGGLDGSVEMQSIDVIAQALPGSTNLNVSNSLFGRLAKSCGLIGSAAGYLTRVN